MELPSFLDLTRKEANATVQFAEKDDPDTYIRCMSGPFHTILRLAHLCPPSINGTINLVSVTGIDKLVNLSNWDEIMQGYDNWGIPQKSNDMSSFMMESIKRDMYGYFSKNPELKYNPIEQVQRMMAAHQERVLEKYSTTEEYQSGESQLYVLLIQLHPSHLVTKGESSGTGTCTSTSNKVWRLVTCHADTNLDSFHDQIIAPAMGWRRHYHGYKFIVPTSGVVFGPQNSDAIDMMHSTGYTFDSEKYELRHVLRKKNQRLHYIYDLGDAWRHDITLIGRVNRGSTIALDCFDDKSNKYKFVKDALCKDITADKFSMQILNSQLLVGEINCPPEDSNGCEGMGNYASILSKGKYYEPCPHARGVNWQEHEIYNAFDFDLPEHKERFDEAVTRRKNPSDGCLQYITTLNGHSAADVRQGLKGKHRVHAGTGGKSEVLGKKCTSKKCANCLKQQHSNNGLKLFTCSRCNAVKYCGISCQREHWNAGHKKECKKIKK